MALPSSLWVDELVTVFVVRFPHHLSFSVAPQVPSSLYYALPNLSWTMFGDSEVALRLPSIVAMALALLFIGRLAARLIHPDAAWLAIFAALAFRNFDYFAVDARPYGLGIAVASASIFFLVRWFDNASWLDEGAFVLLAALLWRIHLFYWPFYLAYAIYGAIRLTRGNNRVSMPRIGLAIVTMGLALAPVAATALQISQNARAHSFMEIPTLRNLFYLTHAHIVLICVAAGWVLRRCFGRRGTNVGVPEFALLLTWWLACPVALFLWCRLTGNGALLMRYASLMLPGLALTVTAITARFLPTAWLKPTALAVGISALTFLGRWNTLWPSHDLDNWRDAAVAEQAIASSGTPVLCVSPFVETQSPVWSPDYPLPGFLYSHLTYYPVSGDLKLFPFIPSPESKEYAAHLLAARLIPAGHFVAYGSTGGLTTLDHWLSQRPELASWRKDWKRFDMISVVDYRKP